MLLGAADASRRPPPCACPVQAARGLGRMTQAIPCGDARCLAHTRRQKAGFQQEFRRVWGRSLRGWERMGAMVQCNGLSERWQAPHAKARGNRNCRPPRHVVFNHHGEGSLCLKGVRFDRHQEHVRHRFRGHQRRADERDDRWHPDRLRRRRSGQGHRRANRA